MFSLIQDYENLDRSYKYTVKIEIKKWFNDINKFNYIILK